MSLPPKDKKDLHGCWTFNRGSALGREYSAHGFVFGTCKAELSCYDVYMPLWLASIDGCLYYSGTPGICAMCVTMYVYNNKALREKWSTIATLDPKFLEYNKDELLQDLKLAGYEVQGCKLRQLNPE